MKTKLVFFVGGAGAGKTTLAKALARRKRAAVFDMDTLSRPASEALMRQAGLEPSDRDSAAYKARCRDLGYRLTMNAALENVAVGTDSYVIGPFTQETADPEWLRGELTAIGLAADGVDVKVVFVELPDEQSYRRRIEERDSPLDDWKLANWASFRQSLVSRELLWDLPASSVLRFDNSGALTEAKMAALERFVYDMD